MQPPRAHQPLVLASPEGDEAGLAARFAAGDTAALAEVVDRYQQTLAHLASRLLGWPGDDRSADLVQEVFVRALMTRRRFKGKSSLKTWLTTITVNECRACLRKQRRRQALFRLWALGTPSIDVAKETNPVESDEQYRLVRQGVQSLPAASREVVVLHYLQQLPIAEVAEALGISPGAVSTRLTRARQQLAKVLPADLLESRTE